MYQIAESEMKLSSFRSSKVELAMKSSESALFILRSKCQPQLFKQEGKEKKMYNLTPESNHSPKEKMPRDCNFGKIFFSQSFKDLKMRHLV